MCNPLLKHGVQSNVLTALKKTWPVEKIKIHTYTNVYVFLFLTYNWVGLLTKTDVL